MFVDMKKHPQVRKIGERLFYGSKQNKIKSSHMTIPVLKDLGITTEVNATPLFTRPFIYSVFFDHLLSELPIVYIDNTWHLHCQVVLDGRPRLHHMIRPK